MYFDQLSGSNAKKYFKKFVKQWNGRKLAKVSIKGTDHNIIFQISLFSTPADIFAV